MKKPTGAKPLAASRGKPLYVPDAGDLVWISFSPQAGREQAGRRPSLVLSPNSYNSRAGLCIVCPITNRAKGYPFEVPLPEGLPVGGVVLSDHLKSADWQERNAERIGTAPAQVLSEVRAKLKPLLGM
ncbi:MAG TPA: endoribonuclease MazF [Gemmataceae bacterium]|jgi:mRNA interferase MazF|nr:endoribonuclease MazF [Gemmataceae bacterium]